ncbi:MAG: hypothetical protein AAGH89_12765 [Verrucomicrobiota bacterium]
MQLPEPILKIARRLPPKFTLVTTVIILAGFARVPYENVLLKNLRSDGFLPQHQASSATEQIGVQGFIGILGGLRYMVATFFTLKANELWETQDWDDLEEKYRLVTLLQPRDAESWSTGAWHLYANASAWYRLDDRTLPEPLREPRAKEYERRGEAILRQGIKWNPHDPWLWRDLGGVYRERFKDPCATAQIYLEASKIPNAPSFFYRFYAYQLAKCPGEEKKAYVELMKIYEHGKRVLIEQDVMVWRPTLIVSIRDLEEKLGIPQSQRIPERVENERMRIITPIRS